MQHERSANPELERLNRMLACSNDNDIVSEVTEQQVGMASFDRDTVFSADSDSCRFDSDDEVKAVMSQLDASVGQLTSYIPIPKP